jgi:hypothetical protein
MVGREEWAYLHANLQAGVREETRGELGAAVGFTLVSGVGSEEGDGGCTPVGLLEKVRNKIRLVCVVECCDLELELVCQLHIRDVSEWVQGLEIGQKATYSDHVIEVHSFVAVVVNLDLASKDVNEGFPLEVFREGSKSLPFTSEGLGAI